MNDELLWFGYLTIDRRLLNADTLAQICEICGPDADVLAYAQTLLDQQVCTDFDLIQELINEACRCAPGGPPPVNVFAQRAALPEHDWRDELTASSSMLRVIHESIGEPSLRGLMEMSDMDVGDRISDMLRWARSEGASDLHLSAGRPPFLRINRELRPIGKASLTEAEAHRVNTVLLDATQRATFEATGDLDLALDLDTSNRFRVNLMRHKQGVAGSYRLVPNHAISLPDLGFTNYKVIEKLLDHHNGLILITGPVGSGKTTTLASLVDLLNQKRQDHIITVEDPIEVVQASLQCNVTQREVGRHVTTFAAALKGALREDPDIIVIGELRDLETIEMAITAAETGHLVIGTLHTQDAATTLNRLLDVFPPSQQQQIRSMTAESLRGIICQRLIPAADGGLTVACEVLINTLAVSNMIRENKSHLLKQVLETGMAQGMRTMDQAIEQLHQKGLVTMETALAEISDAQIRERIEMGNAPVETKKGGWFR